MAGDKTPLTLIVSEEQHRQIRQACEHGRGKCTRQIGTCAADKISWKLEHVLLITMVISITVMTITIMIMMIVIVTTTFSSS